MGYLWGKKGHRIVQADGRGGCRGLVPIIARILVAAGLLEILLAVVEVLLGIVVVAVVVLVLFEVVVLRGVVIASLAVVILALAIVIITGVIDTRLLVGILVEAGKLVGDRHLEPELAVVHGLRIIRVRVRVVADVLLDLLREEVRRGELDLSHIRQLELLRLVALAVRRLVFEGVELRERALLALGVEGGERSLRAGVAVAGVLAGSQLAAQLDAAALGGRDWWGFGDATRVRLDIWSAVENAC